MRTAVVWPGKKHCMEDFLHHVAEEFTLPFSNPVLIFALILLIILLAPLLLKRVNVPGVIGLILSGVVVGPHGLNLLDNSSAVELFSTIGLLYIMFIAGLELDMNEFKANRNKSLVFGFFTFTLPLVIGFPVCYYLLGYDFNASFLTASMFATHTLVTYPIVSKFGIAKNQAVAITVGGTILTDTAVLLILAVIMGNHEGSIGQEFWIRLGISLTVFSVIMFAVVPRIARWFFGNLESEKHSHYIFVLAIVFFAAFLAELAGVEPIIGAFISGLALNKLVPHSSALMNRIEFIGNSLFIPFFLISVGMLVDLSVIFAGPMAIIVAITLSVVALAGKWVAALITQWSFRYSLAQRNLIFGLSSAHAAATLAVILVGYRAGILDENILNGTIILILITSIVASIATERAAKVIVTSEDAENVSNDPLLNNEHILLPIANINNFEKLLDFAICLKDKKITSPVSILSVVTNNEDAETNLIKTRHKLDTFVNQGSATDININALTTIDHNAASGISRISREIIADLIMLGWPQQTGVIQKLIGEKLDVILENTDKTVFITHLQHPLNLHRRIVIWVPPFAQFENGFKFWLRKMAQLASELTVPVVMHCDKHTEKATRAMLEKMKLSMTPEFVDFPYWDTRSELFRWKDEFDFLVLVSARDGSVSHFNMLDQLPTMMERLAPSNSRLVIYPQQYNNDKLTESFDDRIV